jgi:hypothetical protein
MPLVIGGLKVSRTNPMTKQLKAEKVIVTRHGYSPQAATTIEEVWTEHFQDGKPTGKPSEFCGIAVLLTDQKQVVYAQPYQLVAA